MGGTVDFRGLFDDRECDTIIAWEYFAPTLSNETFQPRHRDGSGCHIDDNTVAVPSRALSALAVRLASDQRDRSALLI